ncbi:hypothetical protein C8Q80DRAFT_347457 [Daedaleopsis nitida]|nr:hypothetical protein C8Q80DRAFT_347457 [Daedaleopsis nitida]
MFGHHKTSAPLRDWERQDRLNVELILYGWEEKRVTVRFHFPIERNQQRLQKTTYDVIRDVKHSRNWQCEFCGDAARETEVMVLSWTHLTPPRLILYVHCICDQERARCFAGLKEQHAMIAMLTPGMAPLRAPPPRPAGVEYPLAGSCAACQKDATAETDMQRCSGCKLTRYCSAGCQRTDWKRHKETCSKIYSVLFENWD